MLYTDDPKEIYVCEFPDCQRTFVRQDLRTRHQERHTARGSHLQRKESYLCHGDPSQILPTSSTNSSEYTSNPSSGILYRAESLMNRASSSPGIRPMPFVSIKRHPSFLDRSTAKIELQAVNVKPFNQHVQSSQDWALYYSKAYNVPAPLSRSNSDRTYSNTTWDLKDIDLESYPTSDGMTDSHVSLSQRHTKVGSRDIEHISEAPGAYRRIQQSTPDFAFSGAYRVHPGVANQIGSAHSFTVPTHATHRGDHEIYAPAANFSSMPQFQPPPFPKSIKQETSPAALKTDILLSLPRAPIDGPLNVEMPEPYIPRDEVVGHNGIPKEMPVFGGGSYSRSPLAMPNDFKDYFISDNHYNTGPLNSREASDTQDTLMFIEANDDQLPFDLGMAAIGKNLRENIPPPQPMAVTSLLDTTLPQSTLSELKRHELLNLIEERFKDTRHTPTKHKNQAHLEEDRDQDNHVLSLIMMKTYIGSYWCHFHSQMPILHKPTFIADEAPNLLLIAVVAIGASCLDKTEHSPKITEKGADLSNFLAYHLRLEIEKEADFRPPAQLWVFQSLLLLEIYEKMYSTRILHERAQIFHGLTPSLMRRGTSLIGRSMLDSPPRMDHNKRDYSANGAQNGAVDPVEQYWKHWITSEATLRVAFAAFILDSVHATMFGHTATMVTYELRQPLPCDETLWSATSSAEFRRIQDKNEAAGLKAVVFLEGLKRILSGEPVRTNPFGRMALMAGLLSVTWHMNQRDVQVHSLGVLGGKDKWRGTLTRAFDFWKEDFDESIAWNVDSIAMSYGRPRQPDEENIFESRTVLHHLAHMAMHVDIVNCQIFAKAKRLLGRPITPADYNIAQRKLRTMWAPGPSARDATFFALQFLVQVLDPDPTDARPSFAAFGTIPSATYSVRDDYLLNRPWVLYFAALIVWSYGYALEGSVKSPPVLDTPEKQAADMRFFLRSVGSVKDPQALEFLQGRNSCIGMLLILRDMFRKCRWELLEEAADLLNNCVDMLRDPSVP